MASLEVEKAPSAGTASEETMIFNISLTNWGRIVGKLMILYVFLGCYFTMLLYTGFAVRSTDYLRLPSKYFGDFERNYAHASIQEGKDPVIYKTNIPTGCSATGETITFPDRTTAKLYECDSDKNNLWNVYPWTNSTKGAGKLNSDCFASTTEAYTDYVIPASGVRIPVCSNFIS